MNEELIRIGEGNPLDEFPRKIGKWVKEEIERVRRYERILRENAGNTMVVICGKPLTRGRWPMKPAHLVGRLDSPLFDEQDCLRARKRVFLIDYDLRKGNYPSITTQNIFRTYQGFFPIHIRDLAHPREFVDGEIRVPINGIIISDKDPILDYLEKL